MSVTPVLVDATNFDVLAPHIIAEIQGAKLVGLDTETEDDLRHNGLNVAMKVDPITRRKSSTKKLIFDTRRTKICGFSIYPDESEFAYYINLYHADAVNRVPWEKAKVLLEALPQDAHWVAHNAPYELTMFFTCHGFPLERIICTLQMAVSAYGPDEYDVSKFQTVGLGAIKNLIPRIAKEFATYDPSKRDSMTPAQAELFAMVVAKESDADHSYNGFVKEITYGFGLKKAIETWFGVKMRTFDETIGDKGHMGQLTGAEVVAYGADDAYWAVRLFHRLVKFMMDTNPAVVGTFFNQEMPMVPVYSEVWRTGMRVNFENITKRRAAERHEAAVVCRRLKKALQGLLPFAPALSTILTKYEKWYAKDGGIAAQRYRLNIQKFANAPDSADDFTQVYQIAGAVSEGWATDHGKPKSAGPNFTHYMPARVLIYDLLEPVIGKAVVDKGKLQSDADARGQLQDRLEKALKELQAKQETPEWDPALNSVVGDLMMGIEMMKCLAALAGIEQRMKLYLTPYSRLTDPETHRMYPVLSSMLAARRMATSFPNPMQLAKRGESTYVRGFYLADDDVPAHLYEVA